MMRKLKLFSVFATALSLFSCDSEQRDVEPLTDPWLRDCSPVAFRLEGQVGNPVVVNDWRDDTKGTISVVLLAGTIDVSKVAVEKLQFVDNGTISDIKAGDKINLSGGSTTFTVTAASGDMRKYTLKYSAFVEPFEGTYSFDPRVGVLDGSAPRCAFIAVGGYDGGVTVSTPLDKSWQWPSSGSSISGESDNTVSIKLLSVDSETGLRAGTVINTAGPNGVYADFMWKSVDDINHLYRIIPRGRSRWTKDEAGNIKFYNYDTQVLICECKELQAGTHVFWAKNVPIANYALYRTFAGPFNDYSDSGDGRFMKNNIRNTFTLLKKTDNAALPDHDNLINQ